MDRRNFFRILSATSAGVLTANATAPNTFVAKYSPSGSTVSIKASAESARVLLAVSDQGVGITTDESQQLGRKSFRSKRHQASIPGSGLGFWIASIFVGANGGTISTSSPGQGLGTTVCISLPASPSTISELTALENE